MEFPKEFFGSLLADITSKLGFRWAEEHLLAKGEVPQEVVKERKAERKAERAKLDQFRRDFRGYIFKMKEPFRSRLNETYRMAREGEFKKFGVDEEAFVKLIMKALEYEETWEEKERYLEYFSKLQVLPYEDPGEPGVWYPSIEEELDKLDLNSLRDAALKRERLRESLRKATLDLKKKRQEGGKLKWSIFWGFYRE